MRNRILQRLEEKKKKIGMINTDPYGTDQFYQSYIPSSDVDIRSSSRREYSEEGNPIYNRIYKAQDGGLLSRLKKGWKEFVHPTPGEHGEVRADGNIWL